MTEHDYMQEMKEIYLQSIHQASERKFSRVVCPHTYDTKDKINNCRLCELAKETIFDRSIPRDAPIKAVAKKYSARKKYYSNIILLSSPTEVKLFEYGEKIFGKLISLQVDDLSEYKNFMHPVHGRNMYLTKVKTGPEAKDVDYDIQPRVATSQLPNASVILPQLYDLDNIVELLAANKVQVISQAKFALQKTEIRILPNGNKAKPLFFFKMILWHEYLSPEEFAAVQAGKYNPITGMSTASSTHVEAQPVPNNEPKIHVIDAKGNPITQTDEEVLKSWSMDVEDDVSGQVSDDLPIEDSDIDAETEPICFGQYDSTNDVCTKKCTDSGWGGPCKTVYEEKLAMRAKARRISQ